MFGAHHGAAAVHADRARRLADEVGLHDAADGPGHHVRRGQLRHHHVQDRARSGSSRSSARRSRRSACSCSRRVTADTSHRDRDVLHVRARLRSRQHDAAADGDRAERRTAAGDRRRHQLGDVLPPDRRHPGVAVFLSILFNSLGTNIKAAVAQAVATPAWQQAVQDPTVMSNPANKSLIDSLQNPVGRRWVPRPGAERLVGDQPPRHVFAHPFKVGFADSMDQVFLLAAACLCLAFLILLLMPKIELRGQSASAAGPRLPPSGRPRAAGGRLGERPTGRFARGRRAVVRLDDLSRPRPGEVSSCPDPSSSTRGPNRPRSSRCWSRACPRCRSRSSTSAASSTPTVKDWDCAPDGPDGAVGADVPRRLRGRAAQPGRADPLRGAQRARLDPRRAHLRRVARPGGA